ncbi:AI-2E family transporter [Romboutsia lituseburensis]|uniref:Predicted PurR-regulated permease PerM n=1 Tax=Romboutsia lituseburensis DSM 797 TaxID=1121325 RepID=A0A1G9K6H3_9FIRM|nr:AI-2E family transporter [Romboutsia lituseburensis]CEH34770.1 Membrane protein Lmo0908 [Romboutsia lituseburensis]SDL44853.1 Predicted PurR-regulated permease PerM [Romboutsia lituseburensis DSM 797]
MVSKENIKYYVLIGFISIIIYKVIDSPSRLLSNIGGLVKLLSPFLIGILLALLIDPLVKYIEKKFQLHRILNILISYVIIFISLLLMGKIFIPSIINTLNTLIKEIPHYISMIEDFLNNHIKQTDILEVLIPHIQNNINLILQEMINIFSKTSSDIIVYLFSLTSLIFNISMGVILSIYMLYDKENVAKGFKNLLYCITTKNKADKTVNFFIMCHDIFYHYIIGRILDSAIIGVLAFIGFKFFLRIDNVLFLSFIVFLTNIIPYFGPFIGAVPPVAMALTQGPVKAFWVIIFIFILQQLDGNFIGPKVMGDQVGLSPLWIISAVLLGGSLFGIIGVFLSVPIAAVLKSCIDKYIQNRLYIKGSK